MFPNLYTKRLLLRQINQDDIEQVFKGLSHPDVTRHYGVSYQTLPETQAQMNWYYALFAQQTGIWWGLCFPENQKLFGACGFNNLSRQHRKAEIGFWLLPEYWNQGLMFEAVDACIDFIFNEIRLHRLEAYLETPNLASAALLQKLRFQQEGTFRDYEYKNGQYVNLAIYSRLCSD
ncbi:GNAT family N-acetyltransferase [Adhaeribacter swui]|uniref:GNAT family N-acetyltransferase n=1 Tax=Adhaeribacter swui TaxID=2086471 RepID=A0A7G7G304_9BACT|nr:GNAT family N-acetyltransferase [Adhaeribacter swui]QNF31538.1 GNAT family N-acetyltransferase [Adhaeribacter swui]